MTNTADENIAELLQQTADRVDELLMDRARRDAKIAILTQALATVARRSPQSQHWAKTMLRLSDEAWANVKPEDLTTAHINMEWKGEDVPLYKDDNDTDTSK